MRKDVETFIYEHINVHKYINYCECIVHPDGMVEYARPSHCECLIRITGQSRDYIYEKMPIYESPIRWLTEYTGCASVWTDGLILPKNPTSMQMETIFKLATAKLVRVH